MSLRSEKQTRMGGLKTMLKRILRYYGQPVRRKYYQLKNDLLGNKTVPLAGVRLDLSSDVYSEEVAAEIQSGYYEAVESDFIQSYLDVDTPTIDLGSGTGYTTCLIDKKLTDTTPIVALEANPNLIPEMKKNKSLNSSEFHIVEAAYSPKYDEVEFYISPNLCESGISEIKGNMDSHTADGVSLNWLLSEFELDGNFQLVADIEGSEKNLFTSEMGLLNNKCSLLVIELHEKNGHDPEYYDSLLTEESFNRIDSRGSVYVYENSNIS